MTRPLEEAATKDSANLALRMVDVGALANPQMDETGPWTTLPDQIWSRLKAGEVWLVVQYPLHLRIEAPVWTAPLEPDTIGRLTTSPVRQELVRRLADGQTAVWLLLDCGQAEKDDAVAERLEAELRVLEQTLKLPILTSDPDDQLLASTPLKVAFSVLRIPQGAANEEALAGMLVHCEPDLVELAEPMVFPVFGRGRALLPLVGAGVSAKNIRDAGEFLVGPCSCQVKEQNPGFDLLLSSDWDSLLSDGGQQLTALQTRGILPPTGGELELVPIPVGSQPDELVPHESPSASALTSDTSWLISAGVLAGVAAFVVLLAAMHAGKSKVGLCSRAGPTS